jgi:hypothetical protein
MRNRPVEKELKGHEFEENEEKLYWKNCLTDRAISSIYKGILA